MIYPEACKHSIYDTVERLKTRWALSLLDAVCQQCRTVPAEWLCETCAAEWVMPVASHHWPELDTTVYSLHPLDGLPKRRLYGAKFYRNPAHYWWCVALLVEGLNSLSSQASPPITAVSVASHTPGKRHWLDSALLALLMDKRIGTHVNLAWRRPTMPQHTRPTPVDRWENVREGLQLLQPITGPAVLLDDVTTTGATLYNAALAMRRAGYAHPLSGLTLCYVPSGESPQP